MTLLNLRQFGDFILQTFSKKQVTASFGSKVHFYGPSAKTMNQLYCPINYGQLCPCLAWLSWSCHSQFYCHTQFTATWWKERIGQLPFTIRVAKRRKRYGWIIRFVRALALSLKLNLALSYCIRILLYFL